MVAKLTLLTLFIFAIILFLQLRNRFMTPTKYSLLALGDSYTIGEGVIPAENFPNQLVRLLEEAGYQFEPADVLATTGWTVQELLEAIKRTQLAEHYHFVTLLIGVNNQYRNYPIEEYEQVFAVVLKIAIRFAGDNAANVLVIQIPDWGKSPFAEGRDIAKVSEEIKRFNSVNERLALKYGAKYIADPGINSPQAYAPDGLHPSAVAYSRWAELLAATMKSLLS